MGWKRQSRERSEKCNNYLQRKYLASRKYFSVQSLQCSALCSFLHQIKGTKVKTCNVHVLVCVCACGGGRLVLSTLFLQWTRGDINPDTLSLILSFYSRSPGRDGSQVRSFCRQIREGSDFLCCSVGTTATGKRRYL